jgi:parallel beta-helix repeat protein
MTLMVSQLTAGSLTPPGTPKSSMKTLQEVEPRTPISSLPFTIGQPGSYYLTGNLESETSGIAIAADNVTLDLMGFTLSGGEGQFNGIFLTGQSSIPRKDVVVRNGVIREFNHGIRVNFGTQCRLEDLIIVENRASGVYLWSFNGYSAENVVSRCTISRNAGTGISAYVGNAAGEWSSNSIKECVIGENAIGGISIGISGAGKAFSNQIADCVIAGNGALGIFLNSSGGGELSGTSILRCEITANSGTGEGIRVQAQNAETVSDNNTIADCKVTNNNGNGIIIQATSGATSTANSITNCFVSQNLTYGIMIANVARTRVEGNQVASQIGAATQGIRSTGTLGNFILRNISTDHTQNYFVNAADTYGPIVSSSGELATTGGAAHPWANFSR